MQKATLEKIKRDVRVIKENARIIFRLSADERSFEIVENKNPRLNVIVVIGPYKKWKELLLCEIGISRTRPYNEARGLKRELSQSNIPLRKSCLSLSPQQYQLIAPVIFKKIEKIAYQRVISWEKGPYSHDPFWVPIRKSYWKRSNKKFQEQDRFIRAKKGARFTVSLKEEFLVNDIYWAELNLNEVLTGGLFRKGYLNRFVNLIDLRLNWYRSPVHYKGRKLFRTLKGAEQVEGMLQTSSLSQSRHLLVEVVRRLRDEKKNIFWEHVADMIGWDGLETEESKLAKTALPEPKSRLGSIQIRITTGLDAKKDYIVFEVFPQKK